MAYTSGKLTKNLVRTLGPGRHGDGNGLYLVVDPSGARRWIVRVTVKGQRNRQGKPNRTDFGADIITLTVARERALEYRRLAKQGLNPKYHRDKEVPCFEEVARQVHIERLPTWKNPKHGQQWINTLADYAFPKIGRLPVSEIDQPEVLQVLSPIWTEKHETARRVAQRMKAVLDVARSRGFREGENPVTVVMDARVLPRVKAKVKHHNAMRWQDVPAFYAQLSRQGGMAAKALMFTCLTGCRTSEVLQAVWEEFDFDEQTWTIPEARTKTGSQHRVPLTAQMLEIIDPLKALRANCVFEGQRRHKPLSNMSMLMLLRRMKIEDVTVHGFRSAFRDWAAEVGNHPREVAELSLGHKVGSEVERAYARSDLLQRRRTLMTDWCEHVHGGTGDG
ncbi:integrase [Salipiger aestuarii]|uniref:Integrase n=1 Tax=Salipiger aestuarii TaxID=568098 RepID=A0A327XMC7_9RHOB|nr:site-specific integrase [Salipiger aestuarii]KAB2530896.1 integrase [Salipiger aestuarii]RAK07159.1 integrase [Salipiger aestuarii]